VHSADKSAFKQKKMGQMGKNAAMKNGMRPAGLKEQKCPRSASYHFLEEETGRTK
jgi:hypothetical protein